MITQASAVNDQDYTGFTPVTTDLSAELTQTIAADLGQRYEVKDYLGRGAYATVWRVFDQVAQEELAVKRFESRERRGSSFYRELSTLFRVLHERIVRVINLVEAASGTQYLLLEYCAGGNLRAALSRLRRHNQLCDEDTALSLGMQICEGLRVAHQAGLVHRDLKPENILFTHRPFVEGMPPPTLKLADFGLARTGRSIEEVHRFGTLPNISGSPAYMSPEQFIGAYSPASDVYALAVILYELLSGQLPFVGSPPQLAQQHLNAQPPLELLPPFWRGLLRQMLHKDASHRPSCKNVLDQLQDYAAQRQPSPRPGSNSELNGLSSHCLGMQAFDLSFHESLSRGQEVVAISVAGLFRLGVGRSSSGVWAVPSDPITATASDPSGTLWLAGDGWVSHLPRHARNPQPVLRLPTPVLGLVVLPERLIVAIDAQHLCFDLSLPQPEMLWSLPVAGKVRPTAMLPLGEDAYLAVEQASDTLLVVNRAGQIVEQNRLPGPCQNLWALDPDPALVWLQLHLPSGDCTGTFDRRRGRFTPARTLAGSELELVTVLPASADRPMTVLGLTKQGELGYRSQRDGTWQFWASLPTDHRYLRMTTNGQTVALLTQKQDTSWVLIVPLNRETMQG
jgi:serine/threonine protein kinase